MAEITNEVMDNMTDEIVDNAVENGSNGVVTGAQLVLAAAAGCAVYELGKRALKATLRFGKKLFKKDEIVEVEVYDEENEVE